MDSGEGPLLKGGCVALGFFDGCHLGHQKILKTCKDVGEDRAAVFTFPNHPTTVIPGREAPKLVTTAEERIALLQDLGLKVFLKNFDRAFSSWSAEHFCSVVLKDKLGVDHVVVGHDYRFGHRAAGDVALLAELGAYYGFSCTVIGAVFHQGTEPFVISSTRIRQAVAEGDLMLAHQLMNRPFSVEGVIVSGDRRGRTIGFPTANLSFPEAKVTPPYGVVAVKVALPDGRLLPGVANFGLRPSVGTLHNKSPLLEVHLFDFEEDLYDQKIRVDFHAFVREERRFDSLEELQAQIANDADRVRSFFERQSTE
ncbi:MAG: riboflavin biosynthesis protein RibF [Vulcanimicrobiota bacterium]